MVTTTAGIAAGLALIGVIVMGNAPSLPDDQGEHGLTDLELYNAIESGDPLGNMGFREAVNNDPRRIEGLLLQRIVQPLMYAIAKMQNPTVPMGQIRYATKSGYLHMMDQRRSRGPITAEVIANSMIAAWQKASEVMLSADGKSQISPYLPVMKVIILTNMRDISRAFRESIQICKQAQKQAATPAEANAYGQLGAILESMQTGIHHFVAGAKRGEPGEVIDAEIGFGDTFGGLDGLDLEIGIVEREDLFGAFEFEEYIVTGHRAPSVGLSQYRRMGGRVY